MQKLRSSTGQSRRKLIASWIVLFIVMAFALTMTGCASPTTLLPERSPLPPNLTQPCPELTPLSDGRGATVLRKLVEVSEQYHECRRSKQALIDAVKGVKP